MTSDEIKELAKEKRKSYRIGLLFFGVIAIMNLLFYYRDIITGESAQSRPPVYQLIGGLALAVIVGYLSYRFFATDFAKDISSAEKKVCERKVMRKYVSKKAGHLIRLSNTKEVSIEASLFDHLKIGDLVVIHRAPKSEYVFSVEKKG